MLKNLLIVIYVFFSVAMFAEQNTTEQKFRQKLESVSGKNETIVCNFTQTKKVKNVKQTAHSNGQFFYDNSGRMALIYTVPKGDKIIMTGNDFMILASGKKIKANASSNPVMAQISYMMQACMFGDVAKLGRGWVINVDESQAVYTVKLVPSDSRIKKYVSSLSMIFDKDTMTLNELRMDETSGGYTQYNFMDKKLNQKIDKSVFETL